MFAWAGKILLIDLAKGKIWKQPLPIKMGEKYLGSRGINVKLLWDYIRNPGIDPFSPENVLIFGTGALTCTTAPSSGRTTITCIGPETNLYLKTNMGGHWGAELKFAGYDEVVIIGSSMKPVYIWIDDEVVEIKDATGLWGMDVRETDEALKEELGDNSIKVACIGPAGENLVRFAGIMNCAYNAAARGGSGAVMGSKKLKAIAVRGSGRIMVKDPEKFNDIAFEARVALAKDIRSEGLHRYGTSEAVEVVNEIHAFPSYNYKKNHFKREKVELMGGEHLVDAGYLIRRVGCFGCTIGCHRYTEINSGSFAGTYTGGPEYETIASLGAGTGVWDIRAVIKANEICNIMGLDTISTGSVIQWAMECYEKGVFTKKDTNGIELKFGNADALIRLIPMIAFRKGKIGDILAEGLKRATEKVGRNSLKWANINSKGLEQSSVDTRSAKAYALAFAVNPRGPDHLHTETEAEFGGSPEAIALIEKISGNKKLAVPYLTECKAEIVRWHEDCYAVTDSLGICAFASTSLYGCNPKNMAEMFSAATGIEMNEKEILFTGRRIVTLEKCFNVREGVDRKFDDLPWRMMHEPAPSGPAKGMMNSWDELNEMLDRYYALHGWDLKTSWPYRETLEMLSLREFADDLERIGRLPTSGTI